MIKKHENNPIIKLSSEIRKGNQLSFGEYANNVHILNFREPEHKSFINDKIENYNIDDDIVICGMNRTRCSLNRNIKNTLYKKGIVRHERDVSIGDKVICLKNNKKNF